MIGGPIVWSGVIDGKTYRIREAKPHKLTAERLSSVGTWVIVVGDEERDVYEAALLGMVKK